MTQPPMEVSVKNWHEAPKFPHDLKPRYARKSTVKTYVVDPASPNKPLWVQICDYEPKRVRMVVQVYDNPVAITTDAPTLSPDTNNPPQGRLLQPSTTKDYIYYGPDAFFINPVTVAAFQQLVGPVSNHPFVQPAVGSEVLFQVPANQQWQLQGISFLFTASATVATRIPSLIIDDGFNVIDNIQYATTQLAGTAVTYSGGIGLQDFGVLRNGVYQFGIPPIILTPGSRVRTSTAALQGNDQYSAVTLSYIQTNLSTGGAARVTVTREFE